MWYLFFYCLLKFIFNFVFCSSRIDDQAAAVRDDQQAAAHAAVSVRDDVEGDLDPSEAKLVLQNLRQHFLDNDFGADVAEFEVVEPAFKREEWQKTFVELENGTQVAAVFDLHDKNPANAMKKFPGCLVGEIKNLAKDREKPKFYKFSIKLTPACRALLIAGKNDGFKESEWNLADSTTRESEGLQVFAGDDLLSEINESMAPWAPQEAPARPTPVCIFKLFKSFFVCFINVCVVQAEQTQEV